MGLKSNYQKFIKYLKTGGVLYAIWRGVRYFLFLVKKQRDRFKSTPEGRIMKGRLKVICSQSGISIFWEEREVTKGAGLNVAIDTLGLWTDSAKADWHILEKGIDYFKLKVVFRDLPLNQIWIINIKDEQEINWQINTNIEEYLHIDEFRIISLLDPRYKTWISDYRQGDFPRLSNHWHDLFLSNTPISLVGARFPIKGEFLPPFILETQENNLFGLVQNPPLNINAHLIGFRHIDPEEKKDYLPGCHHLFTGKINLFKDDYLLDTKIEKLRKGSLETVIRERTKERKLKRKLKVLLVNLPWQRQGRWGVRAGSRWPHIKDDSEGEYLPFPFFLAYATSLLQKHDIDVLMIDAIAEQICEEKFLERISRMNFDYLVAETSVPSFYDDLRILERIHKRGIPIILCGPNVQIYKPQFLKENSFIDFVLYGEYEFTLLDLVQCLQKGKDLSKIKGLIYNNGTIIKNPNRESFDINLLPWPHRDGLPMYKYLDAPGEMLTPSVQIMASRGCPFKCQFCLWPQVIYQGNHYRPRDIIDVVNEMEYLVREKGFKSVYFDDDTFNIGKHRMLNFCQEIRKKGLDKIQWAIMARPDLMDEEILENMKKAGLWAIKYGVESAIQNLVDNIGKNMDLRKTERMVRLTKKLGIKVHLTFTFGLPGETAETIEETIRYAQKLDPFSVQFSITTPFPGTKYCEILEKKNLIISKDFSQYDGHFKSVIKLENLTAQELEIAKYKAYRIWAEHLRKKRRFWGNVKRFCYYANDKGLVYGLDKTMRYFKYILLEKKRYLNLKDLKENANLANRNEVLLEVTEKRADLEGDILLIQCPPWDITMPSLGIAYLSNYLRQHGYKTSVLDLNITLYNLAKDSAKYLWEQKSYDWWVDDDLFQKTWLQLKEITTGYINRTFKEINTKFIGLSVNFAGINFVKELISIIKNIKPDIKVILGGWGCIDQCMRNLYPKDLVDVFVVGEGEQTLLETMEVLKGIRDKTDVLGAIFNKDTHSVYKPRPPIINLDSIPWPTFDGFNLDQYKKYRALPLLTSRGCIGNCSFCNDWVLSKPYRFRSAQNVFEEIKYHKEHNYIEHFSFKDLLCNGNINELNLLCELIIGSEIQIHWDSQAIPRKEMTYELLCKLRKSGCETLIYGIESFSTNVLKHMRKLFTKEIAERAIKDTYKAGIKTFINIIVGFPGEADKDFEETFDAIKRNRKYINQIGAISVCLVNGDSDLDIYRQNYGLVLPIDSRIRAKEWESRDGKNTYGIRREKAEKILGLINRLGLSYTTITI